MSMETIIVLLGGGGWASLHVHVWYINKRIDKVERSVASAHSNHNRHMSDNSRHVVRPH